MDLTEAEGIKKRWQEHIDELYKKDLNDLDAVITHLGQTSWSMKSSGPLGSITVNKASGGDGIPAELYQILKDDAVKVMHFNMPANLENSAAATWKSSSHSNLKQGQCQRMLKLLHNFTHFTC